MLRSILFLARTDLAYTLRQRETLLWTFVMPILFMYFIGVVTGGASSPNAAPSRPSPIALVSEGRDPGFLADEIARRLEEANFEVLRDLPASELRTQPRRLTLPKPPAPHADFTAAVLAGKPMTLRFRRAGSGVSRDMDFLAVQRAVYTVLADFAACRVDGASPGPDSFAALRAAPRSVALKVLPAGKRKTIPTGYAQTIPGTLIMFTMMILLTGGAIVLVTDRQQGLLRRLASTPITVSQIVLGKWLGKLGLALVQIGFAISISLLLFDMDWGPEIGMLALVLLGWAMFNTSLAMLLGNLARTEGQMSGLGVLLTMACAALGGCWWPIEVTPQWMQELSHFLPTGWAMDAMHKLVNFQEDGRVVIPNLLAMLGGTVVLGLLARWTFRYE